MILKFRDNNGVWNWIDSIRSIKRLPSITDDADCVLVGTVNDNEPLIIEIFLGSESKTFKMYVKEAYICNETGSTIDVLQSPNG